MRNVFIFRQRWTNKQTNNFIAPYKHICGFYQIMANTWNINRRKKTSWNVKMENIKRWKHFWAFMEKNIYPKVENGLFTWCDYVVKAKYKPRYCVRVCVCACMCAVQIVLYIKKGTTTKQMKRDGRWFRIYTKTVNTRSPPHSYEMIRI